MGKKLSSLEFNSNSFDVIRLIAAIQVVIGHSLVHLDIGTSKVFNNILGWFPGVVILFAISGYLITASAERSASKFEYIKKRLLRIYPALIICFIVTIITISFFIKLNGKEILIFSSLHTTFFQWYTPGFLRTYGTGAINGSLWTIIVELQFYLFTLIFYKKMKNLSIKKWIIIIGSFLFINIMLPMIEKFIPTFFYGLLLETFVLYIYIYLIGAFLYTFKDEILPILIKNFKYIVSIFILWNIINEFLNVNIGEHYNIITGILLPIISISLSYILGKHKLKMDLSYGIYLYHMVIINVLVQLNLTKRISSLIVVYVVTILAAILSWTLVEKPFINMKKKCKNIGAQVTS